MPPPSFGPAAPTAGPDAVGELQPDHGDGRPGLLGAGRELLHPASTATDPGNYAATIDWGEGTSSPATIAYDPVAGNFVVSGSHTYSQSGFFPITVNRSRPAADLPSAINSSATVYAFTGRLDATTQVTPGFTNNNQPMFLGMAEPNAIVRLFAQRPDGSQAIPLGETVAGSNGLWKLTGLPLADATYSILGVAVPTTGSPFPPTLLGTFVLDTTVPRVVGLGLVTSTGRLTATIQDDRSGLDLSALLTTELATISSSSGRAIPSSRRAPSRSCRPARPSPPSPGRWW